MKKKHCNESAALEHEPKLQTIAGLAISPETDIPFGKPFQMGLYEYTIYESAAEQGYYAGIARHLDFMHDQGTDVPAMLDDAQFALMMDAFVPQQLSARDKAIWRAHFIAGWAAVFLGLVREMKDGEML
jgi:hypothetical protein